MAPVLMVAVRMLATAASAAAAAASHEHDQHLTPMLPCNASLPSFQFQLRVVSVSAGAEPVGPSRWYFSFGNEAAGESSVTSYNLANWSDPGNFTTAHAAEKMKGYPYSYGLARWLPALPVSLTLVGPDKPNKTTGVSWAVELKLLPCGGEPPVTLQGDVYTGGQDSWASLEVLLSTNRTAMPDFAMTAAQFNAKRYWNLFGSIEVKTPPKQFPIADRFISGDTDTLNLAAGIAALGKIGFTALLDVTDPGAHQIFAKSSGLQKTGGGVYNPPGGDQDTGVSPDAMKTWAGQQMAPFGGKHGFTPQDIALYNIADEPAFYFPIQAPNMSNPIVKAEWQAYLQAQGLQPADLGGAGWNDVLPSVDRKATDLKAKRLFYWSARFASASSTQLFARATAAIEQNVSYPVPTFANFNCYQGRVYTPGAVANNPNKTDENAAMIGNDWFEFGRARGASLMWTEDWFGDHQAAQWSYYTSKMRSAARLAPAGNVHYGGYVVPVTAGERPDGILTKILSLIGGGGKALEYFVFGPEYNFPGNCYSERLIQNPGVLQSMAKAHNMIGAAEELLWPAERIVSDLAIIQPRSSALWDMHDIDVEPLVKVGKSIGDCTNNELIAGTVDYYGETYGLYNALALAMNTPVDFVDETALLNATLLGRFKVLVLTEPNVPTTAMAALLAWVKAGGTLITTPGAATLDEYNEPASALASARSMSERDQHRLVIGSWGFRLGTAGVPGVVANGTLAEGLGGAPAGTFNCWGRTSNTSALPKTAEVLASFSDGAPAIVRQSIGAGKNVHFFWFPGLSHAYEAIEQFGHLEPAGVNPLPGLSNGSRLTTEIALRHILSTASVVPRVLCDQPHVETPLLEAEAGSVLTVLNWLNTTQAAGPQPLLLSCNVSLGFVPSAVASATLGPIKKLAGAGPGPGWWEAGGADGSGTIAVRLTVGVADFLMFHK